VLPECDLDDLVADPASAKDISVDGAMVEAALLKSKPNSAPGPSKLSYGFLKLINEADRDWFTELMGRIVNNLEWDELFAKGTVIPV